MFVEKAVFNFVATVNYCSCHNKIIIIKKLGKYEMDSTCSRQREIPTFWSNKFYLMCSSDDSLHNVLCVMCSFSFPLAASDVVLSSSSSLFSRSFVHLFVHSCVYFHSVCMCLYYTLYKFTSYMDDNQESYRGKQSLMVYTKIYMYNMYNSQLTYRVVYVSCAQWSILVVYRRSLCSVVWIQQILKKSIRLSW